MKPELTIHSVIDGQPIPPLLPCADWEKTKKIKAAVGSAFLAIGGITTLVIAAKCTIGAIILAPAIAAALLPIGIALTILGLGLLGYMLHSINKGTRLSLVAIIDKLDPRARTAFLEAKKNLYHAKMEFQKIFLEQDEVSKEESIYLELMLKIAKNALSDGKKNKLPKTKLVELENSVKQWKSAQKKPTKPRPKTELQLLGEEIANESLPKPVTTLQQDLKALELFKIRHSTIYERYSTDPEINKLTNPNTKILTMLFRHFTTLIPGDYQQKDQALTDANDAFIAARQQYTSICAEALSQYQQPTSEGFISDVPYDPTALNNAPQPTPKSALDLPHHNLAPYLTTPPASPKSSVAQIPSTETIVVPPAAPSEPSPLISSPTSSDQVQALSGQNPDTIAISSQSGAVAPLIPAKTVRQLSRSESSHPLTSSIKATGNDSLKKTVPPKAATPQSSPKTTKRRETDFHPKYDAPFRRPMVTPTRPATPKSKIIPPPTPSRSFDGKLPAQIHYEQKRRFQKQLREEEQAKRIQDKKWQTQ